MKISRSILLLAVMGSLSLTMYSCKTKKAVAKPAPAPVAQTPPPPPEEKKPEPPQQPEKQPEPEKPNYNFSNIQFEFNSDVLKTESIQILDRAVTEMKKDPSVKFILNGNSSAEGTAEHNMSLSVDRANAVKSYLVNAGISAANFTVKGYGATKPVTSNSTEEGKALNRRVEIRVN